MSETGRLNEWNRKSSDFYRLEKVIDEEWGVKGVYEIHMVVNGNRYYHYHEERRDGSTGYLGKRVILKNFEKMQEFASRLKEKGYEFAGIYEMDILGHKRKKGVAG